MTDPNTGDPMALLGAAVGHHQAGRLAEAERLYGAVLAADPDQADALHLLGVLCAQSGRNARAIELIGAAVARNGNAASYHANLARALRAEGRLAEAAASLGRALALQPDAGSHFTQGNLLKDLGRPAEAADAYAAALALRPDFAEAHANRAGALSSLGRAEAALASLRIAAALLPADRATLYNLARTEQEQGRIEPAAAGYRRALRLDPGYHEARANLGLALRDAGDHRGAAAVLATVAALRPDRPGDLLALAAARRQTGDTEGALAALRRMAVLAPEDLAPWEQQANILAEDGRLDEAGTVLAAVARLGRAGRVYWKSAYFVLVRIANRWFAAGEHARVAALLDAAERALAGVDAELHAWARFLTGSLAARTGDPDGARQVFAGILDHLPSLIHVCLGDDFERRLAAGTAQGRARLEAAFELVATAAGQDGPVVLVACDAGYLVRFGRLFLTGLHHCARPGQRVHLHIADPRPDTPAVIERLAAAHPRLCLGWSREATPPHLTARDRPWFYAAVRFLRLERLVGLYGGAPFVVADIDAALMGDPAAMVAAMPADRPLGLQLFDDNLAWLYDGAGGGLVVLRPEPAALEWCRRVHRFLAGWIEERPLHWCLDQIALVAALEDARRRGAGPLAFAVPSDGRRYRLGDALFVQIFAEKSRPGFDSEVTALLDGIDRDTAGGLAGAELVRERILRFLGIG